MECQEECIFYFSKLILGMQVLHAAEKLRNEVGAKKMRVQSGQKVSKIEGGKVIDPHIND